VRDVGDAARDEVPRHGREVLVGAVALLLERRLVPPRAVLAATADVRDDEGPAALEPRPPDRPGVRREPGDLEPAVAGQERRQRPDLLVVRGRDGGDLEV